MSNKYRNTTNDDINYDRMLNSHIHSQSSKSKNHYNSHKSRKKHRNSKREYSSSPSTFDEDGYHKRYRSRSRDHKRRKTNRDNEYNRFV